MMSSDRYATMAETHMRTYLPSRYQQIEDPETYFRDLGDQIAGQVFALEVTLAAQEPIATAYLVRAGQIRAARMRAEEIIFADLLYLPAEMPDPEAPEVKTDPSGAYLGWTEPDKAAIDAPGPVFEDWESEMWASGLDPATGQAILTDQQIIDRLAGTPAQGQPAGPSTADPTS
jgi:hypothetical protein